MSSREIKDLHQDYQRVFFAFLGEANKVLGDYEAFITDGYRSFTDQTKLYAKGRTTPGTIVTHAKAGESPHNYGLAIDIAFRKKGTKGAIWSRDLYEKLEPLATKFGLQWGGRWTSFVDNPHYEVKNWKLIKDGMIKPEKEDMSNQKTKEQIFYRKFLEAFNKNKDLVEWGDDKHKPEHLLLEDTAIIGRMIDNIARSTRAKNDEINRLSQRPIKAKVTFSEVDSELPKSYNGFEITGIIIKP